ncbi:Clp protease N-terminal domain-containing protein [Lentzea sp. NPDC058450]|uniref:Clp protease N-terminal domain-containing protein n=1 Tax=Lentzea sp. NPDC058450 TaxID=3346505 RepID=UPI00365F015E
MVVDVLTDQAGLAIADAREEARLLRHEHIGTEHLLLGLIHLEGPVAAALAQAGLDIETARRLVAEIVGRGLYTRTGHLSFTPRATAVIEQHALTESRRLGQTSVGPEHLVLGILREGKGVAVQVLRKAGVDQASLARMVVSPQERHTALSELADTGRPSTVAEFVVPATRVRGRNQEIQRAAQVLARHDRNSVVLVGEPGIGRRSVVAGLAQALFESEVPPALHGKRIYTVDRDFRAALAELKGNRRAIAYIGDVGNLREMIFDSVAQVVCVATPESFASLDETLARRLQPVRVEEMSVEAVTDVLGGVRDRMQRHHHLRISDDVLAEVAGNASGPMPGAAIDLMDEVCSRSHTEVEMLAAGTPAEVVVTGPFVRKVLRDIAAELYVPEPETRPTPEPKPVPDPFAGSGVDLWMIS